MTIYHHREGQEPLAVKGIVDSDTINGYAYRRQKDYNIALQLDLLYKDIEAGLFGEAAKAGGFATYIRDIKQRYPKPEDSV